MKTMTERQKQKKYRRVTFIEKNLLNRLSKTTLRLGIGLPAHALLETVGARTGTVRQTPVNNGLMGETFWIVAEHGLRASYVKNIAKNPDVRVKVGRKWHTGRATILPDDDARARSLSLPHKWDAALARGLSTDLLTIRVDLRD
jgi:deazaflavin-dependent oxidoreductase (nitroreductase family)